MSNYGRKTSAHNKELDEVEELLRATEDEMVLKLSVNAHVSRTSSSSPLDQDLVRRFEALKAPRVSGKISSLPPASNDNRKVGDISARFSALKAGSSSSIVDSQVCPTRSDGGGEGSEDEEDEVAKLIQWAKDAARLDPSPSSDEDNGKDGGSSSDDLDGKDDDDADDVDDDDNDEKHKKSKPASRFKVFWNRGNRGKQ